MSFAAIAAPFVGSAVKFGLSKLFGGDKSEAPVVQPIRVPEVPNINPNQVFGLKQFQQGAVPTNLQTPGLGLNVAGGNVNLTRSPQLSGLLGERRDVTDEFSNRISGLIGDLTPGFGALTEARVKALEDAQRAAVGDVRENLGRRRLAGSSFAEDAAGRTAAEFDKQIADARARSFLEELDATQQLLGRQFEANTNAINLDLNQAMAEAGIGADFAKAVVANNEKARQLLLEFGKDIAQGNQHTQLQRAGLTTRAGAANQLAQQRAAQLDFNINKDQGATLGSLIEPIGNAFANTDFSGSLFGGSGSTGPSSATPFGQTIPGFQTSTSFA